MPNPSCLGHVHHTLYGGQVTVAVMDDGTVAVEVAESQALLQWPYLSDISLITAVASVFVRPAVIPGAPL